jgi:hypothetical protein
MTRIVIVIVIYHRHKHVDLRRMVSSGLLRRATRRNNPEDTILHSHRRENLKSYM